VILEIVITPRPAASEDDVVTGRLLSYASADAVSQIHDVVAANPGSGLLIRGEKSAQVARRVRPAVAAHVGTVRPVVGIDVGMWSTLIASAAAPMRLPVEDEGLFPLGLNEWADDLLRNGADFVFTPSLFVRCADWPALRGVLRTASSVHRPHVVFTLVATEAAMLDPAHLGCFVRTLQVEAAGHRFAFVFADKAKPLARRERLAGLRKVLAEFPGSLVFGTEILVGTDVITQGCAAAVGLTGGLRRPRRPWDEGGNPPAKKMVPGLFLRELWETRSPSVYADWFANRRAPTCAACGGRSLDRFSSHPLDKQQVLRHNVHAWLDVLDEISGRPSANGLALSSLSMVPARGFRVSIHGAG